MDTVTYRQAGAVVTICLQRPEVRNAMDRATLARLGDLLRQADSDAAVRAVVLTGGPDAFFTGEDLRETARSTLGEFQAQLRDFQRVGSAIRHGSKPVVAAIGGAATGGGLDLALCCDARIVASNAQLSSPQLRWGLTVTEGASVLLPRLVGEGWAREIALFGRVIDATTAVRIGLATRLVETGRLAEEAEAMADACSRLPVDAVRSTRRLLAADPRPWQDTLDDELHTIVDGFGRPSTRDALESFRRRRESGSSSSLEERRGGGD